MCLSTSWLQGTIGKANIQMVFYINWGLFIWIIECRFFYTQNSLTIRRCIEETANCLALCYIITPRTVGISWAGRLASGSISPSVVPSDPNSEGLCSSPSQSLLPLSLCSNQITSPPQTQSTRGDRSDHPNTHSTHKRTNVLILHLYP